MDYLQLLGPKSQKGSIKYSANHELMDSENILAEAQSYIFSRLRVSEMRQTNMEAQVLGAGESTELLAPTFLAPIKLLFHGDVRPIPYMHEASLQRLRDIDGNLMKGKPGAYTLLMIDTGRYIVFDTEADEAYHYRFWHWSRPEFLNPQRPTNFLTTKYPTILRRACLAFAYEDRQRLDMMQAEFSLVDQAIDRANADDDTIRLGQY